MSSVRANVDEECLRHVHKWVPVIAADHLTLLAMAAVGGDGHALGELVRGTRTSVRRMCVRLSSPGEAEDLTQDTYLRALQALPRFRGDAPVLVWLLSIARHVCADHVRRKVVRAPIERSIMRNAAWSFDAYPFEVQDALGTLDAEKRTAFVLTQLLGWSYEDAATECGCPVGTIRSRVARARVQLASEVRQADAC